MKKVFLCTDGSCLGNPGRGGYGVILRYGTFEKELSEGFTYTTNNRMELLAVIKGLQALKEPCEVEVTTDSQYVKDGITLWLDAWKRNGWRTSQKKKVKNQDLWQLLDDLKQRHHLSWVWVRGHSGHSLNERCDKLARMAASGEQLKIDEGFYCS